MKLIVRFIVELVVELIVRLREELIEYYTILSSGIGKSQKFISVRFPPGPPD